MNSNGNTKTLFAVVNNLLNKGVKQCFPSYDSSQLLADKFSSFFINKVKTIRNSIPENNTPKLTNAYPNDLSKLSILDPTTTDELRLIITETGISSSINDHLSKAIISKELEFLLPIWCNIINLSLASGDISGLKESVILPLLKDAKLDPEILKNYRPVSNLPFLEKLLERVVLRRLNLHLDKNGLAIPNQFGYKKSHSTETLLVKVVNDILIATDKGSSTILLLLD